MSPTWESPSRDLQSCQTSERLFHASIEIRKMAQLFLGKEVLSRTQTYLCAWLSFWFHGSHRPWHVLVNLSLAFVLLRIWSIMEGTINKWFTTLTRAPMHMYKYMLVDRHKQRLWKVVVVSSRVLPFVDRLIDV